MKTNKFNIVLASIIIFILIKLPFDLSVICNSSNEGFYFVYGQFLLDDNLNRPLCSSLFIMIYSVVLKLFGFGAYSIIVIHIIGTLAALCVGYLLYKVLAKLIDNKLYASLVPICWFLLLLTPIGLWGDKLEISGILSLEAEYLCVLFSLLSLYLFIISFKHKKLLAFLSGVIAIFPFMMKASGAVLVIAHFCWLVYLLLFDRAFLKEIRSNLSFLYSGIILGGISFCFIYCALQGKSMLSLKESFLVGSYSQSYLDSFLSFALTVVKFMFRYEVSFKGFSNFLLSLFMFVGIGWSMVRGYFIKPQDCTRKSWSLFAIWSFGNICAVIAPGEYASYYYLLIWPSVAIYLMLLLHDVFSYSNVRLVKIVFLILIVFVFLHRMIFIAPGFLSMLQNSICLSAFSQPQSFQDPVLPYDPTQYKRTPALQVADYINNLIPDKKDRIYLFNLVEKDITFSPSLYIYMKRLPPTTIFSDFLHYKMYLSERVNTLVKDLEATPPKLVIVPKTIYLPENQLPKLKSFFKWTEGFLSQNYRLLTNFDYSMPPNYRVKSYEVYIRKS